MPECPGIGSDELNALGAVGNHVLDRHFRRPPPTPITLITVLSGSNSGRTSKGMSTSLMELVNYPFFLAILRTEKALDTSIVANEECLQALTESLPTPDAPCILYTERTGVDSTLH